jgi:hypothetical protein
MTLTGELTARSTGSRAQSVTIIPALTLTLTRVCGFRRVVDPAARSGYAAVSYLDKQVRLNDTVSRAQLQHEKQQFFERLQQRNERRDANRQRQGAVLADKAKHEGVVQDHKIAAAATGVLQRNPDVQPNRR